HRHNLFRAADASAFGGAIFSNARARRLLVHRALGVHPRCLDAAQVRRQDDLQTTRRVSCNLKTSLAFRKPCPASRAFAAIAIETAISSSSCCPATTT